MSGDPFASATDALAAMAAGRVTAVALAEAALDRIADPAGEGSRAMLAVDAAGARRAAQAADLARAEGRAGALAGLPVVVKDLFDIEGQVTTAGSVVLRGAPPATVDAAAVARLRAAGAVLLGRSHMNEFAYSALGTNPHVSQPRAPWQREADGHRGRAPGGSTSGGAVAVADGMALAALGSDTGGSTRIPAAFCGCVGWRPSQGRIDGRGAFPLADSFDTPGLIVRRAEDLRLLDAVLTGTEAQDMLVPPLASLRLGRAAGMPFDALAPQVAEAVHAALARLSRAGAGIANCLDFNWAAPADALRAGQVTAVEALSAHGDLLEQSALYDPRVLARMQLGLPVPATDYVKAKHRIGGLRRSYDAVMQGFDAVVLPTVAILPPRLAELDDDQAFFARNGEALRNTLIASILDLPAVSLPLVGDAPVGLMLIGRRGMDRSLLALSVAVETALSSNEGA